jgi:predicted nucleic acid-binding protein
MEIKEEARDRKKALIDSSSAILLFKTSLLEQTIIHYNIILTQSVFEELTRSNLAGSSDVKRYCEGGVITVLPKMDVKITESAGKGSFESLGRGEHDTIQMFLRGCGDLIIMDDGRGANACKRYCIPYINALLVPRVLYLSGNISDNECKEFISKIIECGRYSEKIINYARTCPDESLIRFM